MHPTRVNASKTRLVICVALLVLLIVAALAIPGCSKDGQQNRGAEQAVTSAVSPTPTPTPTPVASPPVPVGTPERVGDTIIVIKGSSADIQFDTTYYKEAVDIQRKFVSKGVTLDYIDVEPTAGSGTPTRCDLPDPKSKIIIDTSPEDKDRIRINGKEDRVELKFDRFAFTTCSDASYNFCNVDNHVYIVWIDKRICKACNPEDKCKVTLHTQ
ncbi:MAG TPA: hypothetical protein VLA93_14960 [Pyrinomonadaceae bacterium]|nr:hypothetical protein [Pyrinomonadaceae bacterium]